MSSRYHTPENKSSLDSGNPASKNTSCIERHSVNALDKKTAAEKIPRLKQMASIAYGG
jgi:hypothetical protein